MRRVVLMALLALAMPMAAFADSIIFTDSGTLNSTGTITSTSTASFTGSITNGSNYILNVPLTKFQDNGVVTSAGTVTLNTNLTQVGVGQFTFTGTVKITSSTNAVLFTSSITGGTITRQSNGSYSINGLLANGGLNNILGAKISGNRLVSGGGNAVTGTSVVPEPGTLGLLGTGLIGIAGLIRRKTRIG